MSDLYLHTNSCYKFSSLRGASLVERAFATAVSQRRPSLGDAGHRRYLPVQQNVKGQAKGREVTISSGEQPAPEKIRLGHAIYCVASDRLTKDTGEEVILRWQSAQVLRILADNLGNLVPRDEMIERVWGDVSVTDDSLTQCIKDIRQALGDYDHALLLTLRKRGYKLTGERLTDPGRTSLPDQSASTTAATVRELASYAAPLEPDIAEAPVLAELDARDLLPTMAVLPMRHLTSGSPDPMGIFLAHEIASALGRSEDVSIISQLSVARVSGTDPAALKATLRADFVLSGFLMADGANMLLSIELSETDSGFVLWSDRMRLKGGPLMQDTEVTERIVAQVRNAIMINEVRRVRSYPVSDLKLFSVMHGAVGLMHKLSRKDFDTARGHLEYVASAAPRAPAPMAWLARWHLLRTVQGWTDDPARESRDALDFTARALDIDPECSLALVCEGQVLTHMAHRLDEAAERYEMALMSNPNDAQGRALRGMLETFRDNGEAGKRDTERALHLTPLDPHRYFYLVFAAAANLSTGDYARAETLAKESLRLNRTHVSTLRTLAAVQVGLGKQDAARKTAQDLMRLQPDLRVSRWLNSSPSANYAIGQKIADYLRVAGIPE